MPTGPGSERTRIASQEAAYWYIRYMDEPDMHHKDKKLFLAWLRRSPENVAEILRVADVDGQFARQRLQEVVDGLEESNVVDINGRNHASQYDYNPSESVPDAVKTKLHPAVAFAAMLAVLAIALGFGFTVLKDPTNRSVTTAASEWQHMTLPDGSTVHVDARTHLKVQFTAQRRIVHLYEGQAVFEVAKDPERPFTVSTHIVDVTAVGTRFGVTINPGVTTTVSEGIVKVTPHGKLDDADAAKLLHAGQELRVFNGSSGREERMFGGGGGFVDLTEVEVVKVDAERKLDWANGWLTFQGGETFRDIIAQFNRRNSLQITIDDDSIADKRLKAGYYRFRVDSPESFVKVLESQEGIAVIRDRRNTLRLKLE
jgi:ferric-dicitrate binding protein FerR (iron transport regulator)